MFRVPSSEFRVQGSGSGDSELGFSGSVVREFRCGLWATGFLG